MNLSKERQRLEAAESEVQKLLDRSRTVTNEIEALEEGLEEQRTAIGDLFLSGASQSALNKAQDALVKTLAGIEARKAGLKALEARIARERTGLAQAKQALAEKELEALRVNARAEYGRAIDQIDQAVAQVEKVQDLAFQGHQLQREHGFVKHWPYDPRMLDEVAKKLLSIAGRLERYAQFLDGDR